jgi:hypothetical protein
MADKPETHITNNYYNNTFNTTNGVPVFIDTSKISGTVSSEDHQVPKTETQEIVYKQVIDSIAKELQQQPALVELIVKMWNESNIV